MRVSTLKGLATKTNRLALASVAMVSLGINALGECAYVERPAFSA
jgi:hypothetical protein